MNGCLSLVIALLLVTDNLLAMTLEVNSDAIIRNEDLFFVKKKNYTIEQVREFLADKECTSLQYTQYVKRDGCVPVAFKNQICGGKCAPLTPFEKLLSKGTQCVTCSHTQEKQKAVRMLCKTGGKEELRVVKEKVTVVENCACKKYKCLQI